MECARACATVNGLPDEEADELSAAHYTVVQARNNGESFVRRLCMHCTEPTCVSACLVGSFTKTDLGPVIYDESKCIGCRYCMQACPFQVPRYEWGSLVPRVQKCRMCFERISSGDQPACAAACPTGATLFGERSALVAEATRRINEAPGEYVDHVYGLHEAGGTSVLFVTNVPFEKLGFPTNLPDQPIPGISWRVLSQIPRYSVTAAALLFGIHWITARRAEVSKFELEEKRRKDGSHAAPGSSPVR
jgi:formate dehydrogenase iron-sulfur subunit